MKKYRTIIIVMILFGLGILYYYNAEANNKTVNKDKDTEVTELQKLIDKDLEKSYPQTPREVVKLYSRIITCFYGEEYTEEQKKALALQARLLMDSELLEKNPFDEYYEDLTADIKEYKSDDRKISTYILERSSDVEYKTFQSKQYAELECVYYVKGKSGTSKTDEIYTLRKDESGKWKILYWKLAGDEEDNE